MPTYQLKKIIIFFNKIFTESIQNLADIGTYTVNLINNSNTIKITNYLFGR